MHIIPVLDIKDGLVVRARLGDRDSYRPIETPLSATADIGDVATGLRKVYPFSAFYVADLDAIERRRTSSLGQLQPLLSNADIWLDAGFNDREQLESALATEGIWPVLGSESQVDPLLLEACNANPRLVLSLDFRGDAFLGPPSILENANHWPSRIIVMTLGRVGANSGPDFKLLAEIKHRAGHRAVIAAGGVRDAHDLEQLQAIGISAALVATALHSGALTSATIRSLMRYEDRG
ncbi:phosphoribosylformimino-5-aminoimidazole carboxamide ribotide isomerase [Phyllobacterium sp. 1468]|uniref:HisA/HisF-related TIM barrel protein n=1 Tax=Phyllobacterium sp. 1468 TaxID=2817759 RepID=UPI0028650F1A|nr:HisA/HisF-related TIM barrel protein [Phyllobacterium sp. 1468]MDR6634913.1 phosphoribosylformimino-5-aminoimidazole carboxamide ribotide isomerase [Phyllobacterium sp. 1468]